MKHIFSASIFFLLSITAFSCLNEYNVNSREQTYELYEGLPVFYRSFDTVYSSKIVNSIDLKQKDTIDFQKLSDAAVHLAKLGRFNESLSLLKWLNQKYPNEYQIVSNLGTLYELSGNIDSAYYFIKQGIEMNPGSHQGSEWVHLSILNAKKQIEKNTSWILKNKVLNLNLKDTVKSYSDEQFSIMRSVYHISYQLKERIPFTPDKDLILANILIELGEILELHLSIENAYIAYRMAAHYDPEGLLGAGRKIELLMPLFNKYKFNESVFEEHFPSKEKYQKVMEVNPDKELSGLNSINSINYAFVMAVILVVMLIIYFIIKRRR